MLNIRLDPQERIYSLFVAEDVCNTWRTISVLGEKREREGMRTRKRKEKKKKRKEKKEKKRTFGIWKVKT